MVLFFVQPLERFEQPAHIFLTDTDAGIDHLHMKDHIFRSIFHILFLDDQSHCSFSCIFHCIRQQINDDLPDPYIITIQGTRECFINLQYQQQILLFCFIGYHIYQIIDQIR